MCTPTSFAARAMGVLLVAPALACSSTDKGPAPVPVDPPKVVNTECGTPTGYPGDELCIPPPDPSVGFQLHYGPSNYADEAEIARYLIQPGQEIIECVYVDAPNDSHIFYEEFHVRRRPGSHHLIVSELNTDVPDGVRPCQTSPQLVVGLVGGTSVARDWPDPNLVIPENEGLASELPARAQIEMQLHFFNSTNAPLLREAWMNIHYKDPALVTTVQASLGHYAGLGMNVPPSTTQVIRGAAVAPADIRIVNLYSHYHAHTQRFTAYKVTGTERTLVYESFDWQEPGVIPLDSAHQNPPPNAESKVTGGLSGILELKAGDRFEFECEIVNDSSAPLRWANEALTAEMCILRGTYAPSLGRAWSSVSF